ncbi:MAG: hypothetical protein IT367_12395 [Candidatus Hydrogenedentes bacterium]|nr:hypothetical protein [Candidatus Hydrogenedentota bacterium]
MPVLLALLRGISASGIPERLPFGPHPVFCSGKMPVDGEDAFGAVAQVDVKAGAFLREYGSGVCHAILLPDQEHKLKAVIGQFAGVHVVSTVSELLKLPEIHEGLAELAKEPSLAEFDRFAHLATTEEAFRNFVDVESIATWLSRHADNRPDYRCYFLSQLALMKLHRGDFPAARQRLLEVEHAMSVHSEVFGVEDRLDFVARYADYAIDAWRPDEAMHKIAEIMPHAPLARPAVRAAFYGCACQVFRVAERFDEAIDSGESAVEAAKHGALGELHRDLNYLAHAYIARARSDCAPHCRDADLARAEALLNDSEGEYAPAASTARRIHFGFCRHLRAELARLRGLAFAPATPPDTYAIWDHPWLFTYGSAVSNRANGDARTVYARTLRNSVCAGIGANPDFGPILKLLGLIFSLHAAIALNESIGHSLRALDDALACDELEGWRAQLAPVLECIREASGNAPACAAALLSKVPYF